MQERVRGPPAKGSGRVWLGKGEDAEMRSSSAGSCSPKGQFPPGPAPTCTILGQGQGHQQEEEGTGCRVPHPP